MGLRQRITIDLDLSPRVHFLVLVLYSIEKGMSNDPFLAQQWTIASVYIDFASNFLHYSFSSFLSLRSWIFAHVRHNSHFLTTTFSPRIQHWAWITKRKEINNINLLRPQKFASAHCDRQIAKISLSTRSSFFANTLRCSTATFCVIVKQRKCSSKKVLRFL